MAAELHFSPPEIPEPTLMENVLRSGLFFGAVFQLVCVWAITLPVPKCPETDWHSLGTRSGETVKKAKASAALLRKKAQKESKKNRAGLEQEGPQDTRISWNASSEVAPKAAD
ncbi:protein MANBAL-like [Lagopus leucura]|uniref:protein MANBAL-like n=1 Tax=Lagopus leucura TaxID=30410 RepID=UPI001C66BA9D|nr:protein MANBAL-like [Lagopus leucura]